jgi:hypothetical protein
VTSDEVRSDGDPAVTEHDKLTDERFRAARDVVANLPFLDQLGGSLAPSRTRTAPAARSPTR